MCVKMQTVRKKLRTGSHDRLLWTQGWICRGSVTLNVNELKEVLPKRQSEKYNVSCLTNCICNNAKDTIQNFQLSRVRIRTYSSNISLILLARWRDTGAPVAGSMAWQLLQHNTNVPRINIYILNLTREQNVTLLHLISLIIILQHTDTYMKQSPFWETIQEIRNIHKILTIKPE
jgi:hypothetical protein